jgi:ABC-type lipoprotein export system ATPase subunit
MSRLTALANVELGMTYAGGVNRKRAIEALASVGLSERVNHRPVELSGGEQQRVAIARALVKNPSLFLADEPTGQLDSHSGEEVISILTSLHAEQGITLVVVTHDANIANHCQRIIHLKDGEIVGEESA